MKKHLISFFSVFAILIFALILPGQESDIYQRPRQFERNRDYDARNYRLELHVDLDQKTFRGTNTITLVPLKDNFETCVLDAEELIVDSVTAPNGSPLRFEQTKTQLFVHLANACRTGQTAIFSVSYHGHDPQYGLLFDDETSDHPRMATAISWPIYARHWLPCFDYPSDKVTHDFIITVKNGLKVLGNGRLESVFEDKDKGTKTFHWSQDLPHSTYLFVLAIGPFAVIEDSLGPLPINYWVYEKDVEDARWIFEKTPRMIDFFNNIYGYPYPWEKYDQVTSSRVGGGMESTTATLLGQSVIHDRRAEQDFSWEKTIAHEVAHQWWGDLITLRSWEHTWLNESFGTYSDYLYTRDDLGEDEGAYDLLKKKNAYLQEARTEYIRPIVFDRYEQPQQNFDSHTYPKGAAVLHMLRFILGDDPFFRTLKYFLHTYEFQAVDTHDFMKAVKDATGENMDWFFEQCLFAPGHPVFEVSYVWNEAERKVKMKVLQAQDTSKGVPVYKLPVVIGIRTEEGKESRKVWIEKKEEFYEFSARERPLLVRFDEGNNLLKEWTFEKRMDELLYQLKNDDVIGRAWAASELIRYKNEPAAVGALVDTARNDGFWAVRLSAVETVGRGKREQDLEFFKEKCLDIKSTVRITALRILGDYGGKKLVPFFRDRFKNDDSYLAQSEALRSIGKCGDSSLLFFLEEAGKKDSPRNVIKRASEAAVKQIEGKK
jgi:aminopeptidase N